MYGSHILYGTSGFLMLLYLDQGDQVGACQVPPQSAQESFDQRPGNEIELRNLARVKMLNILNQQCWTI